MILPGKHVKLSKSILNVGSILLQDINNRQTVSLLWDKIRTHPEIQTFERFTLGLDLLFTLGIIDVNKQGLVIRIKK